MPAEQVRVLTGNVGGSFGMKASVYPEYPCLLLAAKLLGRPVKWTDERSESFLSDSHGRDHEMRRRAGAGRRRQVPGRCAFDVYGNLGAYLSNATTIPPTANTMKNIGRRLRDAADRGDVALRVHQHHAGRPLSRRRAAGGQLLHGAADRHRRRRDGHRPGRAAPAQPHPARADALHRRRPAWTTTAATSRPCSTRRWRWPTGTGSPRAAPRAGARGKLRGRGIGQYLEVTAPPASRDGRHPLRGRRHRHHHHRHARLRPGPRLAVRAGAVRPARRAVREGAAAAGRQRPADRRRRHRRLEEHDGVSGAAIVEASAHLHRAGHAAPPRTCWRPRSPTSSSSAAASASPAPTAASASWSWPRCARHDLPDGVPDTLDVQHIHEFAPSRLPERLPRGRGRGRPGDRRGRGRALQHGQRLRGA